MVSIAIVGWLPSRKIQWLFCKACPGGAAFGVALLWARLFCAKNLNLPGQGFRRLAASSHK